MNGSAAIAVRLSVAGTLPGRLIAILDEGGVALAAIRGLNEKLKAEDAQKDAQIKVLEKRLSDLEQSVKTSGQK